MFYAPLLEEHYDNPAPRGRTAYLGKANDPRKSNRALQAADAADRLHISTRAEPAAWSIAEAMGSLGGYVASLEWSAGADLNWPRRDFDTEHLRLAPVPRGTARAGLTLSAYRHPDGWMREDRLWRDGEFAATDRDWARYAVLADRRVRVITYDRREGTVAVPSERPLLEKEIRLLA